MVQYLHSKLCVLMESGQTGSGKTFTMQGLGNEAGEIDYEYRGLIPRTLEYLFDQIEERKRVLSSNS